MWILFLYLLFDCTVGMNSQYSTAEIFLENRFFGNLIICLTIHFKLLIRFQAFAFSISRNCGIHKEIKIYQNGFPILIKIHFSVQQYFKTLETNFHSNFPICYSDAIETAMTLCKMRLSAF